MFVFDDDIFLFCHVYTYWYFSLWVCEHNDDNGFIRKSCWWIIIFDYYATRIFAYYVVDNLRLFSILSKFDKIIMDYFKYHLGFYKLKSLKYGLTSHMSIRLHQSLFYSVIRSLIFSNFIGYFQNKITILILTLYTLTK